MFDSLLYWIAQLESGAEKAGNQAAEEGAKGGDGDGGGSSLLTFFLPVMLALLVMMVLMRPKKADQKHKERLAALKKNDRVVTAGGIIGTVTAIRDDSHVTLRIDESTNTKMQILKSSIIKILGDEKDEDKEKSNK